MATSTVTLKVTRSEVGQVGVGHARRDVALDWMTVYVDDVNVGTVEAYIYRVDRTPNARTRLDGAPRRGWFGSPKGMRSSHRNASRRDAVIDVLVRGAGWSYGEAERVAKAAKVEKLKKETNK